MNNILVNLSVISKIKPNDKIYMSSDNFVSIEHESFLQGVLRYIYKNSRKKNINNLNNFYSMVYAYIDELVNSKYMYLLANTNDDNFQNTHNNIKNIHKNIKASIHGLENLKKTYSPDVVTVSQIDVIINEINNYVQRIESKIKNLDEHLDI